jgi:pilus assembly protein Flp/PilA
VPESQELRINNLGIEEKAMRLLRHFVKNESGATAIEYALIASGIAMAIIVVVKGVGTNLNATFTTVQNALR